ncbi:glycosyl hydrolase family 1 [Alkalibaculum bacchi]|uniref:Glycosyl hydrolase family 1 n=1 Tax=Alkalibaculum bacchi TaxID=645887 RepID=A0A366HZF9_9FIRM|nr:glycoside hydrolase family 1 protein [Alkalibaculum bacchi]RBP59704.1 glycosyl hydrolase family 1 [Alkalibaculum bacchi]
MKAFKLGNDFIFGTATSSTQIEGGDKNNTWYEWSKEGKIRDLSSPFTACDHWNRVEKDIGLLIELHVQSHRMSLEWSRIEPEPGQFSKDAIDHYRKEIKLLLKNNIEPLITLHHFSDPLWFKDMGGWMEAENIEFFTEYVEYVVKNIGDLVCQWVTINEPNVYSTLGYAIGIFPPGQRNIFKCFKVMRNLIKAHIKVYDLIHETREREGYQGKTIVGYALHIRIFDGLSFLGKKTAQCLDYIFHTLSIVGMTTGHLKFPLSEKGYINKRRTTDFIGVNFYTRNIVEFILCPSFYFYHLLNDKDLSKNDQGWDIYPEGIYRVCKKYYKKYELPIYITENGISDRYDNRRPKYIGNHLFQIKRAIDEGVDIQRYYHWSLMDNFEWIDGETGRFGLYHCNFQTQKRTPRKSAMLYAEICYYKEVTQKMIEEFSLE